MDALIFFMPDIFNYLEAAAKLGDRLIIAVNDDDSVRKLKGETRPINVLGQPACTYWLL